MIRRSLALWLVAVLGCSPGGPLPWSPPTVSALPEGLLLVMIVDQMRADELTDSEGGFGWLHREGRGFERAMVDLSSASRALRNLADYLERNPSALVRGRPGGEG